MKITLYHADQGDCLLLAGDEGTNLLIDGGMTGAYQARVAPSLGFLARTGGALDLVCVSHIDQDHIGGVLQLMEDIAAWRVYDFQQGTGNEGFPRPAGTRPPQVRQLWHNAFQDQVEDNQGLIEDQLVANARVANMNPNLVPSAVADEAGALADLATSVRQSLRLRQRVGPEQLRIPVNGPFQGGLISAGADTPSSRFGGLRVRVVGPRLAELTRLRQQWNDWLETHQDIVRTMREQAREEAEFLPIEEGQLTLSYLLGLASEMGDREAVTTPNLASIMLLVEEGDRSILLPGDGHADDIVEGLAVLGELDGQGRKHVDVLKVQHHGSEHNIHEDFCRAITADHYLFCGDGAHGNPELPVVRLIYETRLRLAEERGLAPRFHFWFSGSSDSTSTESKAERMRPVEAFVRQAALDSGRRLRYRFVRSGSKLHVSL